MTDRKLPPMPIVPENVLAQLRTGRFTSHEGLVWWIKAYREMTAASLEEACRAFATATDAAASRRPPEPLSPAAKAARRPLPPDVLAAPVEADGPLPRGRGRAVSLPPRGDRVSGYYNLCVRLLAMRRAGKDEDEIMAEMDTAWYALTEVERDEVEKRVQELIHGG